MTARYTRNSGYTVQRRSARPRKVTRTVERKLSLGPNAAKVIGFSLLALLAFVMVSTSGSSNSALYEQAALRQDISEVEQEIEQLKVDTDRARSLQAVNQSAVKAELVPIGTDVQYLGGEVAGVRTEEAP